MAGFDFSKTFSPVAKPVTVRVILTVALFNGWGNLTTRREQCFFEWSLGGRSIHATAPRF